MESDADAVAEPCSSNIAFAHFPSKIDIFCMKEKRKAVGSTMINVAIRPDRKRVFFLPAPSEITYPFWLSSLLHELQL